MSVIKRNKKDVWQIQVITGYKYVNNVKKPIRYSEMFYGKKTDARIRENEIKSLVKKGSFISNENNTYNDLIDKWYQEIAEPKLEIKTLEEYTRQLVDIREELGHYKITELKAIHFLEFYNKLRKSERNLSENTILHYYALNNTILNYGVKWELLERNVNKLVDRPKPIKKEVRYYDKDDINLLLECIKNEPLKYQVVIQLAIDSGCRRGELTGLCWEDVDFTKSTISINKTTQRTNIGIIEKDHPKNSSSIRTITIAPQTIKLLLEYKKEQEQLKKKLGSAWQNSNKILTNKYGGNMHPDTPSKIFKKIQLKYNLKSLNFHGLRHTSASMLIDSNIHTKIISKRLGHSSSAITDTIYSHIFVSAEREASRRMSNNYFK